MLRDGELLQNRTIYNKLNAICDILNYVFDRLNNSITNIGNNYNQYSQRSLNGRSRWRWNISCVSRYYSSRNRNMDLAGTTTKQTDNHGGTSPW